MTEFNKAVKHIETCLFWDFVDGQWLDTLYTPLDRDYFNRLMQGVMEAHKVENDKLREAVATAIRVQTVLCGDADSLYCRNGCPLHRPESNDCLACDVIAVAQELGIEVDDG